MMNNYKIKQLAHLLLFPLLLGGCIHKELCYMEESGVNVRFDWEESNATTLPAGMRVLFYPLEGGEPYVQNLLGADGGEVNVPQGVFHVVCFNNDTQTLLWDYSHHIDSLHTYTRAAELVEYIPGFSVPDSVVVGDSLRLSPEPFWCDTLCWVTVEENQQESILLHPKCPTTHITYEVRGIEQLSHVTLQCASLSGLSGEYYPTNSHHPSTYVTHPIEGKVEAEKVVGEFDCLGIQPHGKQLFTLYLWSGGGNVSATFDVTQQIADSPSSRHIHLIIESHIVLPSGVGDAGFSPSVEGWNGKDIELTI